MCTLAAASLNCNFHTVTLSMSVNCSCTVSAHSKMLQHHQQPAMPCSTGLVVQLQLQPQLQSTVVNRAACVIYV